MARPMTKKDFKEKIGRVAMKHLGFVEAGGAMGDKEAKQILRYAVRSNCVDELLGVLDPYIDWEVDKNE